MKRKCKVIQDSASSCGACCIASVVTFYDGYVPLYQILEDTLTDKNGTNAYNIINALKSYGFNSYGIRSSLDNITNNKLPAIAHVIKNGYEHFLVIYQISKKEIFTMDPEFGFKKYLYDEFTDIYDDVLIICKPINSIVKYKKKNTLFKLFKEELKNSKVLFKVIIIESIFIVILSLIISMYLKISENHRDSVVLLIGFIFLIFLKVCISYKKNKQTSILSKVIDKNVTLKYIKHIFDISSLSLERKRVGEIVEKVNDLNIIKDFLISVYLNLFLSISSMILFILVMFYINVRLSIIYILVYLIYFIFYLLILPKLDRYKIKNKQIWYNYSGNLFEYLNGILTIKNINKQSLFYKRIVDEYDSVLESNFKLNNIMNLLNTLTILIKDILNIIIIYISFKYLIVNDFQVSNLIIFIGVADVFSNCIEEIINIYYKYLNSKAIINPCSEFMDIEEENKNGISQIKINNIKITNLNFSYNNIMPIIKNLNFNINKGDKVLITGPSGVGKSTLAKLLNKTIDDYTGEILLNGINYKKISLEFIRKNILYISQNEILFSTSIKENITLDYESKYFNNIIKITQVDKIIKNKSCGLNEQVLENASNLSGGEKARIILARALNCLPKILIIDETLSSLREKDENKIIEELLKMEDLTLLYITHRNKDKYFEKKLNFKEEVKNDTK